MELFERRRYYFCTHCGTFRFIETPAVEGVQALEARADARPCPLCRAPLMRSMLDERFAVDHCQRCRGLLIDRATFVEAITQRRARAGGPPVTPQRIDARELDRRLTCPSCARAMETHPYSGPGNIVIDTCSGCDLIWLDYGELQQITDAPGSDRGRSLHRTPDHYWSVVRATGSRR
jgi:Zn-finger nucleic acid-binding protein